MLTPLVCDRRRGGSGDGEDGRAGSAGVGVGGLMRDERRADGAEFPDLAVNEAGIVLPAEDDEFFSRRVVDHRVATEGGNAAGRLGSPVDAIPFPGVAVINSALTPAEKNGHTALRIKYGMDSILGRR